MQNILITKREKEVLKYLQLGLCDKSDWPEVIY